MSADPFAHGMPAGDHHTWVRAESQPCPDCKCCSLRLCETAIELAGSCGQFGTGTGRDLHACPCWREASSARARRDREALEPGGAS